MREQLLLKKQDLKTLMAEAYRTLEAAPEMRELGRQELEVRRIHLLEAMLLLVEAELLRTPA